MDAEKGDANTVIQTVYEQKQGGRSMKEWVIHSLVRPFAIFIQEPIIQLFGAYLAFVYGVLYREFLYPWINNDPGSQSCW